MIEQFKTKRIKNKKFLEFVSKHECCLSAHSSYPCHANVQAHHLLKPYDGVRGMGLKANDKNLIPLCQRHHIMLHKRGNELAFFEEMAGFADYGKVTAQRYWTRSPHNDDN